IDWRFRVGDRVKVRLVNEMDSDHPMPHPFHVHGAGRFLILSRDGVDERNLVWKDTVLVRTGETVDILLAVTNPGTWMAHCHIAEHHESGMMFSFNVDEAAERDGNQVLVLISASISDLSSPRRAGVRNHRPAQGGNVNRTSARWFLIAFAGIGVLTIIEGVNDGFTFLNWVVIGVSVVLLFQAVLTLARHISSQA